MAAGDVNTREVGVKQYEWVTGTCEAANGTAVPIAGPGRRIVFAMVQNADDEEGARVVYNSNNGTADSLNGSIYITSASSDVDTWNYLVILS
jgi:hypothetical protein|tara:strand:+ start:12354 stop:12629 length:276 start_codon:yes stop_codon:yes gene_type:complete